MQPSQRANQITPSATLAVATKAAQLRAEGVDVIGFGAGEPDFPTPPHVCAAAKEALDRGATNYAKPASGIPEAKAAVIEKFRRENDLQFAPDEVIVTLGGKEALALAFMALLDPGDEVLLPVPYWVSFPEQIGLAGGKVVPLTPSRSDFRLTPEEIVAALSPKTKIFVFNSPSNPGGFAYTPDEVREIAAALAGHDIMVFSDEMYDRLRYGDRREHLSFANAGGNWRDKTLTFNATSKSHSMTGWRLGYAAGPNWLIKAMAKIQSHTTSGAVNFAQYGLVAALTGDQSHVEEMRQAFEQRGTHMAARLNALAGVSCLQPSGAFYCFPDVSGVFGKLDVSNSTDFCAKVLEDAHVALVPGGAFGMDTHVRLSFATGMAKIDAGLDRLEKLLGKA